MNLKPKQSSLAQFWIKLTGDAESFTVENRAFNAISIITLVIMLILLPFNIYIGLKVVWIMMLLVIAALFMFYYYSRVRRKYKLSMACYCIISYAILIANYFYNSGSLGPTIYLFFLTFQLLIAFTDNKDHIWWMLTHVVVTTVLFSIEFFSPEKIPNTYASKTDRFFDLSSTTLVILACMYFITIYLRSNYTKEKKLVSDHATLIEEQNEQISQQNEQLKSLLQEKSKILSVLGHDLRGPLNSITSVLELLNSYPVPEKRRMELQADLLTTTRNTSDMVSNLLTWSSKQMNGLQVHFQKVRLLQVAQQVYQMQQNLASAKSITLKMDIDDELYVLADVGLLELCLRNIVNNAIKFSHESSTVQITATTDDNECMISISDHGIGMSQDQLDMLFTLDIHSTYGTNNEKGIGLGLVLCKEFATLHNSRIWASSKEGLGSTFYLSLPLYMSEE